MRPQVTIQPFCYASISLYFKNYFTFFTIAKVSCFQTKSIWIMRRRKCFHALTVIIFITFTILFLHSFLSNLFNGWALSLLPIPLSYLLFYALWLFFILLLYNCLSFTSFLCLSFLSSTFSLFSHSRFLCLSHCFLRVKFSSVVHSFWNICLPTLSFLQYAFINLRFSIKQYNLL